MATETGGQGSSDPPKRFRRNVAWAAFGNAFYAACQWLMLIALARLGTPETVGKFALGLALTAPIFLLAGLQLRGVQATDSRRDFRFGTYFGTRVVAMVFATASAVGLGLTAAKDREAWLTVLFVALAKAVEGLSDVHYGYLQQQERLDVVARSLIARGVLAVVGVVVGLLALESAASASAGMALAWLSVLLVHDIPSVRHLLHGECEVGAPVFARAPMQRLFVLAAPLGVVLMLGSLQTNIPRFVIERVLGNRDLGVFAVLSSLVAAGGVFVSALGQSASPGLARLFAAGDVARFRRNLGALLLIGAVLGGGAVAVAILAGEPLLRVVFGAEYAGQPNVFIWLMVGGGLGYVASLLGHGMTAARQFRAQVPLFLVLIAVLGILCLVLVPPFGLLGCAWALAVAATVQLLGSAYVVLRASKEMRPSGFEDAATGPQGTP
ncbi:polysaccharide biosynthesis protein [Anaeromyxobacter sp. K]|uniref:lipopolysaccharide biosynthesis protein n=1 Tax=Anaeromyxobacter sp. (strain K) TaxID=447217 RepID=UPI00017BE414|nr:lipopolysaccharide biosynthesis protein [Anaeromyxobacter sp. K]ACG75621.1 polysaccharide biosynthesis protein [Anaeromyxobacter sp. K]